MFGPSSKKNREADRLHPTCTVTATPLHLLACTKHSS